ncbi:MAG: hypothetical protein BroJett007_33800 [Chloroflexota bacterium]|nr:MAG: hypothetical protein BroJett007_33800 [Chloroflexota bacterium]
MNDQWKEYVESLRRWSNVRTCMLLKLIDAQDAVVKAARKLVSNCLSGSMKRDAITDCERALIELAELKRE